MEHPGAPHLAPAEEDAGQWRPLSEALGNDLSVRGLLGAPALPLAAERVGGSGQGERSTSGGRDHHSARAAAVALRSHAYGQQLLKRIMLLKCVRACGFGPKPKRQWRCSPPLPALCAAPHPSPSPARRSTHSSLVYGLIMGRDWLAAQVHGPDRVAGTALVGPLSWAYRSGWSLLLCAVTAAVAWSVRKQSTPSVAQAAPRTTLLFRAILLDLSLGPHNNAALLEYLQKPGQECGGAATVASCIVQRYWPATHLAYGLCKSTYGYPPQVIFFPELLRNLLFVACSLLAVCIYDGPGAALDATLILALCSRAALSFCTTLLLSPADTLCWRDLDRAGLSRDDLLRATCPRPLRRVRDRLCASLAGAGRWAQHVFTPYLPQGLGPLERWLSATAVGAVLCILVGHCSLHDLAKMQINMYFAAHLLAMAYNSLFFTNLQRAPEPGLGLPPPAAVLGTMQPELEWGSLTTTGRVLGSGAAATVVEARLKGSPVAVKCWLDDAVALGTSEAAILMSLRHPHILTVFGVLTHPPALVTERGQCSLQALLCDPTRAAALTWPARVFLLRGIAAGCDFLHAHSPPIIHGDLKTRNIIVAFDGTPKLADFGSSYIVAGVPCPHEGFSVAFAAPEVLRLLPISQPTAVDVYSFGIVCLCVCDTSATRKATLTNRRSSTLRTSRSGPPIMAWRPAVVPDTCPSPLRALIARCTHEAPAERCAFKDVVGELLTLEKESHTWGEGLSQPGA